MLKINENRGILYDVLDQLWGNKKVGHIWKLIDNTFEACPYYEPTKKFDNINDAENYVINAHRAKQ